jgi:glycosyl transferase family 87
LVQTTPTGTPIPHQASRSRAPLLAGSLAAALTLGAALSAWPDDSPLVPLHGGHPRGDELWSWLFLTLALLALAAYVAGVLLLRRRRGALAAVAALAAAVQLAPLAGPLLLSTDAWTYWDYGRLAAIHGANPYRAEPADYPDDPAFSHVGTSWRRTSTIYGPAFTLASEPVAHAAGSSADAAAWIYKALAAAAMLLATLAAARAATDRVFACAFVGWNPVVALHAAGGGHNDAWMAALVVGALALGASGRRQLAGAAWAAAILVKWVPLLLLPLRAVSARSERRRVGHLGFALTLLLLSAASAWRFGVAWLHALEPVARKAGEQTSYAVPSRIAELGVPRELAAAVLAGAFLVAYALLLRQAARGRARLALVSALLLLATPWLVVWYLAWPVALAAAEEDRTAQWLTIGLSAYLLPQAVPL